MLYKFAIKSLKCTFVRTSVNNWENKIERDKNDVPVHKKERPNVVDNMLLKKIKDAAMEYAWLEG